MIYQFFILFFWSLVAATFFPVSSEVFMAGMIQQNSQMIILPAVVIATIGNVIGAIITFFMGWKGGEITLKKLSEKNRKKYDRVEKIVNKYGAYSMVLAWTPFIGDFIVLFGGVFKLPILPSILWMTIGKFLRYLVFALSVSGIVSMIWN
ncbi:MAG TPA: DedA family protein [Bacteroidetes bacterium]|nr:DedA family protein [Bacteroidota bacterium]